MLAAKFDVAVVASSHSDELRRQYLQGRGNVVDEFTRHNVFGQHRDLENRLIVGARLARAQRERRRLLLL